MKVALVLGGALSLPADVAAYTGPVDGVVACNDAGAWWPGRLDAWVTLHPENMSLWREKRSGPAARIIAGHRPNDQAYAFHLDLVTAPQFPGMDITGSSGMFAAKVALCDLGFDAAVLCGIPLEKRGGNIARPGEWKYAEDYRPAWLKIPPAYRARMRSMSGWTRVLLGRPEFAA